MGVRILSALLGKAKRTKPTKQQARQSRKPVKQFQILKVRLR